MAALPLARPAWRTGQVLLPEHFLGLESSLAAEAALRASLVGPPSYGVARLVWNGDRPEGGALFIAELTAALPGGIVVDVPGNARMRGPLDLKAAGRGEVEVYAHVLEDSMPGEVTMDPPAPADIPRRAYLVELTSEPSRKGSLGRIALGVFAIGAGGVFRLSEATIPPLLRLDTTPYLTSRITKLRGELAVLEQALDESAIDALGRGETLGPIQRARLEARKLTALMDDLGAGVPMHPYTVFVALRAFSLDLYLLDERATPWQPPAYDHDDPGRCFGEVLAEISARVQVPAPSSPVIPFVPDNGRLVAADLPAEALSAPEIYVAVLKERASDQVPLEGVRFASPGRLRLAREFALRGIRLTPSPRPPFRHGFGSAVDFYRLSTGGLGGAPGEATGEWSHVVRERALAFMPVPELEGQRVVLCWRRP